MTFGGPGVLLDLVQNLALLVAMAAAYRTLAYRWDRGSRRHQVYTGFLFGLVALVGMMTPVRLMEGLIFDGRSIVLGVAGFVGGPVVALVAAAMAAAYRAWIGGVGIWMGLAVIAASAALGVAFHAWRRRTGATPGMGALLLFGLAIHVIMAALLLTLPGAAGRMAWTQLGAAILVAYPLATLLTCKIFLDYERRDRDEAALEESEARLRTLWASVGDALVVADTAGRVTLVNPAAEALTGWRADEAVGRPIGEVLRLVDERTGETLSAALSGSGPRSLPVTAMLLRRDGTRCPVAESLALIRDSTGRVTGSVVVFRDQGAEREARRALLESRQRMALALDGAELGTWDWNIETGAVVSNARWAEMVGLEPVETVRDIGDWSELVHPEDLPRVMEVLDRHLAGGTSVYETEHRLRHVSGRWVWVLDRGRVLERAPDGRPLRASGTHLDITARKVGEAERAAREERLERQNQVLLSLMGDGSLFSLTLKDAVQRLTAAGTTLLESERASFWWYTPGFGAVRCWDLCDAATGAHSEGEECSTEDASTYTGAHRAGQVVSVSDVWADPRTLETREYLGRHGIRSLLDVPVWLGDQVAGILSFETVTAQRAWSREDERLAATLSVLLTVCLEASDRARAEAEVDRQLGELMRVEGDLRASLAEAERARRALLSALEDREEAEAALRESEAFARAVMHHLPIGVAVNAVDPSVEFVYMNDNFPRIYGTTREALAEPDGFWEAVYRDPEIRERMKARVIADVTSGDPERMHWEDVPLVQDDGGTRYVSARNTPVPARGMMISTVWDVTERIRTEGALRESEKRYRELFESSPQIMWVYDVETLAFLDVNGAAVRHYGYGRDEFLSMTITDIRPPEDVPALLDNVARLTEGMDEAGIWRHVLKDGTLIDVEIRSHTLEVSGRPAELVMVTDVTERLRQEARIRALTEGLEDTVRERTRQLREANAELESFSYTVSHDLKAPLRAIDGYSALLEESVLPVLEPEDQRLVREVRRSAQQMGRLIEDLLAFSRVGRAPLTGEAVALGPLVHDLVERERQLARDRSIRVEADGLPDVWGDPALIRQAFDNILGNAVKFTRTRDVARIGVTASLRGGMVEVSVRDNGVGFDTRYRHKLFRVFERLHYPDEFEGTGVGLAIVKRVVERHGGRVSAESELGVGTVLTLTLPAVPGGAGAPAAGEGGADA